MIVGRGFSLSGHAGANRVLFSGRLDRHALSLTSYRIIAVPAGGKAVSAAFKIVGS